MTNLYLPDLHIEAPQLAEHVAFWRHCAAGELRFQRCTACGTWRHPPSPMCARCRSTESDWQPASDDAELYSYTIVHHPATPGLREAVPYNVAIVAFPSLGFLRLVSNVVGVAAEDLAIGMPLVLEWQAAGERRLPRFRRRKS